MMDPIVALTKLLKVTPESDLIQFYHKCPPAPDRVRDLVVDELEARGMPIPTKN